MPHELVVLSGPDRGMTIALSERGAWTIGRADEASIRLKDEHVSRIHCRLETAPEGIVLRDSGSSFGTCVNGWKITQCALQVNEVVRIGHTEFCVRPPRARMDAPTLAPGAPQAISRAPGAPPMAVVVSPSVAMRLGPDLPSVLPLGPGDRPPPPPEILDAIVLEEEEPEAKATDASEYEIVEEPAPPVKVSPPKPAPRVIPISPVALSPIQAPAPAPLPISPAPPVAPPPVATHVAPVSAATGGGDLANVSGLVLGTYTVGERIAEGETGNVFRAHDAGSGRDVALKVLRMDLARSPAAVDRFFRGARTMMPLRHPHLVPILDCGTTVPYCWLAMEFIEGDSLVQVLNRLGVAGMLDWRQAFRIGVHVTRALCFIHQRQIIHRNLTPRNVLVRHSDKMALLSDLVLAKAAEDLGSPLTKMGELVGDIHYMSPERIQNPARVDARSDIYSLGALLYALLTGRPPHAGASAMDTITLILQSVPESPRKRQLSIAEMFSDIVMKMLAKRPDERHQSAGELLQELNRIGKFQGISA